MSVDDYSFSVFRVWKCPCSRGDQGGCLLDPADATSTAPWCERIGLHRECLSFTIAIPDHQVRAIGDFRHKPPLMQVWVDDGKPFLVMRHSGDSVAKRWYERSGVMYVADPTDTPA